MSVGKKADRTYRFIDIQAINSSGSVAIKCDFCVGKKTATHLIYRLKRDNSHTLDYGCAACAAGWREIKDRRNDRVV